MAASPPAPVLGSGGFRNLARPGAFSDGSPALGGGKAPSKDALRTGAATRLPTAVVQPTPGGGGAKSTGKAVAPFFRVSTFSRWVCAVSAVILACCRAADTTSVFVVM